MILAFCNKGCSNFDWNCLYYLDQDRILLQNQFHAPDGSDIILNYFSKIFSQIE